MFPFAIERELGDMQVNDINQRWDSFSEDS